MKSRSGVSGQWDYDYRRGGYCPGTWAHTCMYIKYMWIKVEEPCPKQGGEQACLVVYVLERSDHRVVVIL